MTEYKGAFLWYELMTTDVEGAKAFYTELVGWGLQPWSGAGMEYAMFTAGDRPVAGLMLLPEEAKKAGAPPHWMAYAGAPDLDATVKEATDAGASIPVPPMDIPEVGRWSLIQDPQGALLAAFTPREEPKELPGPPAIGDFSWNELVTTDADAAIAFYEKIYGWRRTQTMDMGPMGPYHLFMAGENQGGGVYNKPAEMPWPPHWLFYVRAADLDEAVGRCGSLGGKVLNGPMEVPGGDRVAQCLDPQGAAFALHQTK